MKSLNEFLHQGPVILEDLCELQTWSGIITDIEKAFLQVGLHQGDQDIRFLWLKEISMER